MPTARVLEFTDAVAMNKSNPQTFEVPTDQEIDQLNVGDNIKVSLGKERFWILITKKKRDKNFVGIVDNDVLQPGLKCGDVVTVERRHIYNFQINKKK